MRQLLLVPILLVTACVGSIDEAPGPTHEEEPAAAPAGGPRAPEGPPAATGVPTAPGSPAALPACAGAGPDVGVAPLRRLTREQYLNTVRDLLAGARISADALSPDE